ncbi:conserved hypothetical protein [Trichormus variabilis ATCC 29413]|uniref:Uncharacterized protein n=3 Tax=Anabaena variabilis TaxID=264691 RepID=Q3MC84_TRIV2|nr:MULTISPECIES: hypothetical protein [Nostocaceae]ABA21402.1 conserved hypothetical protein [Trichormus variabilis ATCC 29413]MBC1217226.1 hypothetical protein [Trichormus variabilis ARAD]MBC1258006.1 hypothetical protein [Trichormus variabilis V5]MBC1270007.1 hypothetical protein [Trichormus variabilis FSR]MBC1305269.1 hypothetical protein [Trichormus variabilis N2B]
MYLQGWQHFLLTILVASISGSGFCIKADAAKVKQSDRLYCHNQIDNEEKYFYIENRNSTICQTSTNSPLSQLDGFDSLSRQQILSDIIAAKSPTPEVIPTDEPDFILPNHSISQQNNESPQLEGQPGFVPQPNQKPMEPLLNSPPVNYGARLERLRQRLREAKQPSSEGESYRELGLRVRERTLPAPIEQPPQPPIEKPRDKFKPIGSLQAYVGYFHTDNVFSSDTSPIEDGLFFYGLRLASAYFPLGKSTYLSGSIEGNLIRYVDQTKYNYNQLAFNLGIYQQFSKRMYGEIGWSNQQFFYAKNSDVFQAGNRFLNENSLYLSLGRRDPLTDKLTLDSFYELSWKLADPDDRSRIMNSFWLSLSYSLQKPLKIGLNYQLNLSDFTERDRQGVAHRTDQYHRLYGSIIYRISGSSSLNLQTGFSFGDSTASNIDFESWFLNINYHLKIGEF